MGRWWLVRGIEDIFLLQGPPKPIILPSYRPQKFKKFKWRHWKHWVDLWEWHKTEKFAVYILYPYNTCLVIPLLEIEEVTGGCVQHASATPPPPHATIGAHTKWPPPRGAHLLWATTVRQHKTCSSRLFKGPTNEIKRGFNSSHGEKNEQSESNLSKDMHNRIQVTMIEINLARKQNGKALWEGQWGSAGKTEKKLPLSIGEGEIMLQWH